MPRMPLQPCDHCYPNTGNVTSASENIKLKIIEDKLRNDLAAKEHIHEQYLTEEQVLEKHYTKEETDSAIQKAAIEGKVDLNGYATEEWVESKNYLTEHQDISGKQDNIEDLEEIREGAALGKTALQGIPAEYVTEEELEAKGYLTEHQSLEEYAKKDELFSKDYNDLENKPEIPEAYNDEEIRNLINTKAEKEHTHDQYLENEDIANLVTTEELAKKADIEYVDQKVADLVDSAPEALNTLNELAVALNNHEDAYDALLETVGNKADKEHHHTDYAPIGEFNDYTNWAEAHYAKKEHKHDEYLTEHQSLEGYAKTADLFSKDYNDLTNKPELFSGSYNDLSDKPELFNGDYNSLTNKPEIPSIEGLATEAFVTEEINKIEIPEAYDDSELRNLIDGKAASDHVHEQYLTEDSEAITEINQRIDNLNIPSIEGLASEEFVINKIAEAELNDKDVDISGLATKEELAAKAEKEHSHSYNDLSDLPEIPSTEGLASEQFVSEKIAEIELKEGPQGPQGETGPQGPQGIQGEPGEPGKDGIDGKDGEQGPQGEPGKSAFELARANGHDFETEEEWLESLRGEQGIQGEKGEPGYTPIKGVDYFDGEDGENGQSAYEIWLAEGNTGTTDDFIASLKGDKGDAGLTTQIKVNEVIYNVDDNGLIELPKFVTPDELHEPYDDSEIRGLLNQKATKDELSNLDQKIEKNTVLYNEYVDNAIANIEIPEAELYKVDFNNPNYADAKAAYESGKLLVLINAAPDVNSYALMNYVSEKYITFTKFLTSRSEAYGSFNTYYLSPANTWEVSKEVRLNKVEANPSEESIGELNKVRIGKEIFTIPQAPSLAGYATEEFVNKKILEAEIADKEADLEAYYTKAEVNALIPEVPTKVSELENDANYANETKVLELIENNTNAKIGFDFTTNITVGHLKEGTVITADMTIGQIIKNILCCEHEYETYIEEPTCIDDGYTRYECINCGYSYEEAIPADPSLHRWEEIPYIEPDCTNSGNEGGSYCSICDTHEGGEYIPATGHIYGTTIIEGVAPTCTETGLTDGSVCARCWEEFVPQQVIPALGHNYGDWEVITEPQIGVPGLQRKTCSRCDSIIEEEIPALEPEEPTTISYLSGTFGNPDLDQDVQDCPDFLEDFDASEQEAITMHYVNNMTEYSVASEDDLVGRHGFAINTPFVKEPDIIANDYEVVSEDPYLTRPAIILPAGYSVTAWNTDVDNSSLSECTLGSYVLTDGRTVYCAADFPQSTGTTTTHYLTISKN